MAKEQPRVLLVEDDPLVGNLFTQLLPAHGMRVDWVEDAERGLDLFRSESFDLVVSDKNLPGMSGIELLREVRAITDDVDVIIMTAYADMKSVLKAVEAGVYDYITKPFDSIDEVVQVLQRALQKRDMLLENRRLMEHLKQANTEIEEWNRTLEHKVEKRTEELRQVNSQLEELTLTDDVTGLYNQRFLYQRLPEEFKRARRHLQGLAVIMLDIDHFKRVNDDHDHLFGSRVLKRVGEILQQSVRGVDMVVRYGGDEFTLILPHTNLQDSLLVAQRVRAAIEGAEVGDEGDPFQVTASVGVAVLGECQADSPRSLLRAADRALYAAKENGRNRVAAMKGSHPFAVAG